MLGLSIEVAMLLQLDGIEVSVRHVNGECMPVMGAMRFRDSLLAGHA